MSAALEFSEPHELRVVERHDELAAPFDANPSSVAILR
jgi:hypothetical protein